MSFNNSALKLGIGTFFAQVLSLLALPLLTRAYSPSEFGFYNLMILIAIVLLPVSTLKIESLIITSKNDFETKELLNLSLIFPIIISVISFPIVLIIQHFYKNLVDNAFILSLFMSFILLTLSYISILNQLALKTRAYKKIAFSGFLQNFSTYFLQVLLGLYRPVSRHLILGFIIGRIIGILPMIKIVQVKRFKLNMNFNYTYSMIKKYSNLNKLLILTSVIEALIFLSPSIIALHIFGIEYSGHIGLVQMILLSSATLIGGSYGSILFSEVASITSKGIYDKNLVKFTVLKIFKPLFYFSMLYAILVFTMGEKIFSIIFTSIWADSARLMTWLAFPFAISLLWRPIVVLLFLTRNWKHYFYFTCFNVLMSFLFGYFAFILELDWKVVTCCFFVGQSFGQIIGGIFTFKNYMNVNKK